MKWIKMAVVKGEKGWVPVQNGPGLKGGKVGQVDNGLVVLMPDPTTLTESEKRAYKDTGWTRVLNVEMTPIVQGVENWMEQSHLVSAESAPPVAGIEGKYAISLVVEIKRLG